MKNQQRKVRLLNGNTAIIEQTKPNSAYVHAFIGTNGTTSTKKTGGSWGILSKSKIAKDNNGYVKA